MGEIMSSSFKVFTSPQREYSMRFMLRSSFSLVDFRQELVYDFLFPICNTFCKIIKAFHEKPRGKFFL